MREQLHMPEDFDLTAAIVADSGCRCQLPRGAFGSNGWHFRPHPMVEGKPEWPHSFQGYEKCPDWERFKLREERLIFGREVVIEAAVPIPYRHMLVSNFDPRRSKPIPEALLDWTDNPVGFVLLYGPQGTGKTHIATALLVSSMVRGRTGRWKECSGLALDLSQTVRAGIPIGQDPSCRCEVLLLDEYLAVLERKIAGQELLDQLIAHRFRHGLGTIVTTNRTLEELEEHSGWISSRLMSGLIHERDGIDQRAGVQ